MYFRCMKRLVPVIISIITPLLLFGQSQPDPCGTPPGKSPWLKEYQKNPSSYATKSGDVLYLPLTIFAIGDDTGLGAFGESNLLVALCRLQEDFADTDINFYLHSPFKYIYNSAYFEHETVLQGANMMFDNNIPNTINNYFVKDPAGNCGYNLPYAGIAMNKSCSGPLDHTWAHEVGHNLSLPHPFIGWEGGVGFDGSIPHNYLDPAPDTVLIDYTFFQDTLILDTMIIDTVIVERVDGSNCSHAADGFCDTKPDYLGTRWPCNEDNFSNQIQTDPTGETFVSDGQWIMSYSFDQCASSFSNEQVAAMRANILDEKADYLDPSLEILDPIEDVPELYFPLDEELVPYSGLELDWEPVENAEGYLIQLGFEATVTAVLFDTIVYDNSATLFNLNQDYKYYWRVMPINKFQFCTEFSDIDVFVTGDFVSTENVQKNTIDIVPNPWVQSLSELQFRNIDMQQVEVIELFDSQARPVFSGSQLDQLKERHLESGMYLCHVRLKNGDSYFDKLIIME